MAPIEGSDAGELRPLKTLDELLEWTEQSHVNDEIVSEKELFSRVSHHPPSHPKTLICHDMMGGYLEDRFYKGSKKNDAYRFYHWSGIDTFVYFSHSLVTIPPVSWVNAAHQHGVKVLGTFITEWNEGADVCKRMLADEAMITTCVSQLVNIARHHKFEGWLFNIENKIDPEQVGQLINFVKKLTLAMKESCPDALVIWYDSVTIEGKLLWQNELNNLNRAFFDVCDGIFLNYTWTEDHLRRTQEAAGERAGQVYVGLDMFGRNFYEGGKFNTYKALEVVRANKLSAAIFAQGWTYETQDNFVEAEKKMWKSLAPYLAHHGPCFLPFMTSFCQGFGEKYFLQGKIDSNDPWHNLSKQQYQPLWSQEEESATLNIVTSEAFTGGGCLGLTTVSPTTVRLFVCGISWKVELIVTVCYKWSGPAVPFSLVLQLGPSTSTNDASEIKRFLTLKCETGSKLLEDNAYPKRRRISGSKKEKIDNSVCEPMVVTDTEKNGWKIRSFSVKEVEGNELKQIDVKLEGESTVLIGKLDIINRCIKGLV
ncbi:cytosolic endo-beta-N-acetylglucosaminidase [Procambarus clarkii]|uniref:cytosolic endo-beta-N-acetylglucosaminidase n=1 Tax=Procambarus clarkii TaxID=6728 RepID=UPI001E674C9F|nr:cytosolic endo-beta-N-acetylglucosaminidase-like [Procambarus clarkii]